MSASYTGPTPSKLTKEGLEQLWVANGGKPGAKQMAAAVALAESDGEERSTDNDSDGSVDRGYWQINSVHGNLSTYDPNGNARAAVAISANGTDWSPWVTVKNGAYKKFLSGSASAGGSEPATSSATGTPAKSTSSPASNPLVPAGRGSGDALTYLMYAVLFAIGAGLLWVGIERTAGKSPAGGDS